MPLPKVFTFEPMTETGARLVACWRYEPPYDFYNHDPTQLEHLVRHTFLNPDYHFYQVLDEGGVLIAFRCFGEDARVPGGDYHLEALDTGGGLRPDLTGQGLGPRVLSAALDFARPSFAPAAFRVMIAAFNQRARRSCEKAGFVTVQQFNASHKGMPFLILMRDAQEVPPCRKSSI